VGEKIGGERGLRNTRTKFVPAILWARKMPAKCLWGKTHRHLRSRKKAGKEGKVKFQEGFTRKKISTVFGCSETEDRTRRLFMISRCLRLPRRNGRKIIPAGSSSERNHGENTRGMEGGKRKKMGHKEPRERERNSVHQNWRFRGEEQKHVGTGGGRGTHHMLQRKGYRQSTGRNFCNKTNVGRSKH